MGNNVEKIKKILFKENQDIVDLKILLKELRTYYQDISSTYSIKDDLVEFNDKRTSLSKKLDEELNIFREKRTSELDKLAFNINKSESLLDTLTKQAEELSVFKNEIEKINSILTATRIDGTEYKKELLSLLKPENVEELSSNASQIVSSWEELFDKNEKGSSLYDRYIEKIQQINKLYDSLFSLDNDKNQSRKQEIDSAYSLIMEKYQEIVTGYKHKEESGAQTIIKSYSAEIEEIRNDLLSFYKKIFGTDKNDHGIQKELDKRLASLKEIEGEAKKVINLSSDAGLAGGFWQRGEKAKQNKFVSLCIFVGSLLILGICNFSTIEFNKLHEITIESFSIRILLNIPFIWIAIVSNINLNKYSRLEEEYAHKESLAKSFERYKEQIKSLEDKTTSKLLMAQLLETNIQAFQKNAAETMVHAKSDMNLPIFDKIHKTPKSVPQNAE